MDEPAHWDDALGSPAAAPSMGRIMYGGSLLLLVGEDLRINSAWGDLQLIASSSDDLVGSQLGDVVHRDDLDDCAEAVRAVVAGVERPDWISMRLRSLDGAWRPVRAICSASVGGERTAALLTCHGDLRRSSESAARAAELFDGVLGRSHPSVGRRPISDASRTILEELATYAAADATWLSMIDPQRQRQAVLFRSWSPAPPAAATFEIGPQRCHTLCSGTENTWDNESDTPIWVTDGPLAVGREVPVACLGGLVFAVGFGRRSGREPIDIEPRVVAASVSLVADATIGAASVDLVDLLERRVHASFDDAPLALAQLDLHGRFVEVNPTLCRALGRSDTDLLGLEVIQLLFDDGRLAMRDLLQRCVHDREMLATTRELMVDVRGRRRWFRVGLRVFRDHAGDARYISAIFEDLHDLKHAEESQRRAAQRYQDLLSLLPDAMFLFDPDGRVRFANGAAVDMFSAYMDAADASWSIRDLALDWLSAVREATPTDRYRTIEREISPKGRRRYFEIRLVAEFDRDASLESVLVVLRDLTERHDALAELAHRAAHDSLTTLPNRASFLSALETALTRLAIRPSELAVLFFDLDRFKIVNDSLGHSVGDELLIVVSDRLRRALRPNDVLARLGGDEFTVLVEGIHSHEVVHQVLARLQRALAEPITLGTHEFKLSASVGVAVTSDPNEQPEDLLRWADAAMYRAKANGPGQYAFFDEQLSIEVRELLEMDQRLVNALARREVQVHFQPEVELATGRILGCEALLRWAHPERGMLSLGQFSRVAEETGAIIGLGTWVLEQACQYAVRWRELAGGDFVLRVNMSARELEHAGVVDQVRTVLDETGLPPQNLCLEITETAMIANPTRSIEILSALSNLGVELAVDDFGTGYSSLIYLKRLPVDVVKIDRAFVDGLPDDEDDLAIVDVIVNLSRSMELGVTAEGVERQRQRRALLDLGCPRGQGFLFDRALPPEVFTARLESGQPYDVANLDDWREEVPDPEVATLLPSVPTDATVDTAGA